MATYPYTDSSLNEIKGNKTRTAISPNMLIKASSVNGTYINVGAIKKLSIAEDASVDMVHEVGTDGAIDSVRNKAVTIKGTAQRTYFDRMQLFEAFGRSYIHLKSQVYKFDIVIYNRQAADPANWIITTIKNVSFTSLHYDISPDNYIIMQDAGWVAEDIFSVKGVGGKAPAATGGYRGTSGLYIPSGGSVTDGMPLEQAADMGLNGRRGALDVPGFSEIGGGV